MTIPALDWPDIVKTILVAALLFLGAAVRKALIASVREWRRRKAMWAVRDARDDGTALLVSELAKDIAEIREQVNYNGGNSLKDEVAAMRREMRVSEAARRMGQGRATWEGMVQADGTVVPIHVSPEWMRLTGLSRDDTANGGWARAVSADDRARVCDLAEECAAHGTVFSAEYELVCVHPPHGRTPVRHTGIPVLDAQRRVVGWVGELVEIPPHERRGTSDLPPVNE